MGAAAQAQAQAPRGLSAFAGHGRKAQAPLQEGEAHPAAEPESAHLMEPKKPGPIPHAGRMTPAEKSRAYRQRKKVREVAEKYGIPISKTADPETLTRLRQEILDAYERLISAGSKGPESAGGLDRAPQVREGAVPEPVPEGPLDPEGPDITAWEREAARRAFEGYAEVTMNGDGDVTKVVKRYDSGLAQLLLKAHRPKRYREQSNQA